MTIHWWHVAISWVLAAAGFGGMVVMALRRQAVARRRLAQLDPRGGKQA
jgi:hypothetical protein